MSDLVGKPEDRLSRDEALYSVFVITESQVIIEHMEHLAISDPDQTWILPSLIIVLFPVHYKST